MKLSIDNYLDTLLKVVPRSGKGRFSRDYVALIHVPSEGPEVVYSMQFGESRSVFTLARYEETVWSVLENRLDGLEEEYTPKLEAIQATVEAHHPAHDYLDVDTLRECRSQGEAKAGLDYYLMLWQREGEASVVECWEPFSRQERAWLAVIGSLQVLSSQFEYEAATAR